jgi:hypothetical protein
MQIQTVTAVFAALLSSAPCLHGQARVSFSVDVAGSLDQVDFDGRTVTQTTPGGGVNNSTYFESVDVSNIDLSRSRAPYMNNVSGLYWISLSCKPSLGECSPVSGSGVGRTSLAFQAVPCPALNECQTLWNAIVAVLTPRGASPGSTGNSAGREAAEQAGERERQRIQDNREAKARQIESEACKTLIEAAALAGQSVDLAANNACSQQIDAMLDQNSRYVPVTGPTPRATPRQDTLLDGSNIPNQSDFRSSGTGVSAASPTALDNLTAAASPTAPPGTSSPTALDNLVAATTPVGLSGGAAASGSSALDRLTRDTTTTPGGDGRDSNSTVSSDDSAIAPPLTKLVADMGKQAARTVINLDPDGKAILTIDQKLADISKLPQQLTDQAQIANRFVTGQATSADNDYVMQKMRNNLEDTAIINPFVRRTMQANEAAAVDLGAKSLSVLDQTFDAAQQGLDADGNMIAVGTLDNSVRLGPLIYGVAKNLPLVGKPIERAVTAYGQLQDFLHQ